MIKFFKKLLGIKTGCGCPNTPKETVAEILTPPAKAAEFVVESAVGNVPLGKGATYIPPAKPANKKVKAVSAPITEGNQRANVKRHAPNGKRPPAPPRPRSPPRWAT